MDARVLGRGNVSESDEAPAARRRLRRLIEGHRSTSLITAAVRTGLIEPLADGPTTVEELARELDLHAPSLARLLRALSAIEVVEPRGDGYVLGRLGMALHEDPLAQDLAVLTAEEYLPAWNALPHSVATGENAFVHVFGMTAWEHRKRNPELGGRFDHLMSRRQSRAGSALADACDFAGRGLVVDVGGGHGEVLMAILRANPRLRGVVFDQPHVVETAAQQIERAGLSDRCIAVGGSFLDSVPPRGDVYLLRHVMHNWEDAECLRILERCREAIGDRSQCILLVLERLIPENGVLTARDAFIDLHMLAVPGGRERTRGEYRGLLEAAGFELERVASVGGMGDLLQARPR